jgi:hypothetical protein
MPPTTPVPTFTSLFDASSWLAHHGFNARTPPIRSSDSSLIRTCPFLYYLSRRLSIVPAIKDSEALSHGSWFHAYMEGWNPTSEPDSSIETLPPLVELKLAARSKELATYCDLFSLTPHTLDSMLAEERKRCLEACVWAQTALDIPIGGSGLTIRKYVNQPGFTIISCEPIIDVKLSGIRTPVRIAPDALLYDSSKKRLFIIDYKTTSKPPSERASVCPIEFQTRLYSLAIIEALRTQTIQEQFGLPADTVYGGMAHICVQKPSIRFSGKDRNTTTVEKVVTRGPNKGVVQLTSKMYGDPVLGNYLRRVRDWYLADGDYVTEKLERETCPVVNISYTTAPYFEQDHVISQTMSTIEEINRYATMNPEPAYFPQFSDGCWSHMSGLSHYAGFYLSSPHAWSQVMRDNRLIFCPRDIDITPV